MDVLAVIPARGGSKEIVKKNLRLLNQKPLLYYQIKNSINSKFISDVVVTSEDDDILNYASNYPVFLRKRPYDLATDQATLDAVIYDATHHIEFEKKKSYQTIITLQPTSPLLTLKTLDNSINKFLDEGLDTLIPVVDNTHLHWKEESHKIVPEYDERLNRQWLPKKYKETGAFLITKRKFVTEKSRFGNQVEVSILDNLEGLDVDTDIDFLMAETAIKRLKVIFVVNGNQNVGMGHIYRTLTIADGFIGHDIKFLTYDSDLDSIKLIKDRGYSVTEYENMPLFNEVDSSIIINDILDTDEDYIKNLKDLGFFVVNFEDLGKGSKLANLVFNALYEKTNPDSNHKFGYEYECLKEQFFLYPPIEFKNFPQTMFVTFGGVDQNNLTLRLLRIAPKIFEETPINKLIVVLGSGYSQDLNLDDIDSKLKSRVEIYRKVDNMPNLMSKADIALTSNGRTVYELASMAIPTISIAQNDRETLHLFARYTSGINYLGISCTVNADDIFDAIYEISTNNDLRRKMYLSQKDASRVIKNGLTRIKDEIISEYWMWKREQNKD